MSHPLFDECFIDSDGQENYISRLNVSRHWVLDDHRIMGRKAVLPGTACLELARAAFETHAQTGVIVYSAPGSGFVNRSAGRGLQPRP
ncbi:MAG: hypothetical protein GY862_16210 [Gammaproteobacteria bacterium]|nr:hypothetical protein [Gammaproteobacteria bacterium]